MTQARQENDRGIEEEFGTIKVDDEVSSFEEVEVQKQLVKQGKIEVAEIPRFMMEARRKELEQWQWQKVESTLVVKEK